MEGDERAYRSASDIIGMNYSSSASSLIVREVRGGPLGSDRRRRGLKPQGAVAARMRSSSLHGSSSQPAPSYWIMSVGYRLLLRAIAHPDGLEALLANGWVRPHPHSSSAARSPAASRDLSRAC